MSKINKAGMTAINRINCINVYVFLGIDAVIWKYYRNIIIKRSIWHIHIDDHIKNRKRKKNKHRYERESIGGIRVLNISKTGYIIQLI